MAEPTPQAPSLSSLANRGTTPLTPLYLLSPVASQTPLFSSSLSDQRRRPHSPLLSRPIRAKPLLCPWFSPTVSPKPRRGKTQGPLPPFLRLFSHFTLSHLLPLSPLLFSAPLETTELLYLPLTAVTKSSTLLPDSHPSPLAFDPASTRVPASPCSLTSSLTAFLAATAPDSSYLTHCLTPPHTLSLSLAMFACADQQWRWRLMTSV